MILNWILNWECYVSPAMVLLLINSSFVIKNEIGKNDMISLICGLKLKATMSLGSGDGWGGDKWIKLYLNNNKKI